MEGYAASSIDRAMKRIRSFARRLPNGLLGATKRDVESFYADREALARNKHTTQNAVGLSSGQVAYSRQPSWTNFLASSKQFYAWAERQGLISAALNPVRSVRQYPTVRTGVPVRPEWYCRMLHDPSLSYREGALLWLLGHGLTPAEVRRLTPQDVDLEAQEVHVRGARCARSVPLSDRAVVRLRPWVTDKQWRRAAWLFPSGHRRPLSDRTARDIVRQVARRVFPGPSGEDIRRLVHPAGFRHAFLVLALRRHVAVDCLVGLTGISRANVLSKYLNQTAPPERLGAEFRRIVSTYRDWL